MRTAITFILSVGFYISFGQSLQIESVDKLDSAINSKAHESLPMVTATGDTLYFIRSYYENNTGGAESGQDIWYSTKVNGQWTPAKNTLNNLNSSDHNAIVGISSSGNHIYLINSYSPPVRRNRGVVYATKANGIWSDPKELDLAINLQGPYYGFYMHPDEDVLVISMKSHDSEGSEDLYVSLKENELWGEPIHLGEVINTEGFEISPFLTAEKDSLFFASEGHDGMGKADIFFSTRLGEGWTEWSMPVNLGAPVNSAAFDAYYFQSGQRAYFSSDRDGDGDIFVAHLSSPEPDVEPEVIEIEEIPFDEAVVELKKHITDEQLQIYFELGKYRIDEEGKRKLTGLAESLTKIRGKGIGLYITGFTDSSGSEVYNKALSRKRAEQVAAFLLKAGVPESQIILQAKGEEAPVDTNQTLKGRASNRRVEIFLIE